MKIKTNTFGKQVEQLMLVVGYKNASLADYLGYDVSYISKWISGKSIPAIKNRDDIAEKISNYIIQTASVEARRKLEESFMVIGSENVKKCIKESLINSYNESIGHIDQMGGRKGNVGLIIKPTNRQVFSEDWKERQKLWGDVDIYMLVDLFAMDHAAKLKLAGIEKEHFIIKETRSNIRFHMSIFLDVEAMDIIYDTILLIHMLTGYSLIDFELYKSRNATGKIEYAIKDQYAILGSLSESGQCRYISNVYDEETINQLYQNYMSEENQENLLFQKTSMWAMLFDHSYIQMLLAPDISWVLGHMTEQFLPDYLFNEILDEIFPEKEEKTIKYEISNSHMLVKNVFEAKEVRIMIYESAIYNFLVCGEMDFYNIKIIMNKKQRIECLEFMRDIVREKSNIHIFMIEEGFSDDFQYITNPCIFLSQTSGYLRLENKIYKNNILKIRDKELMNIFIKFYTEIWNGRQDIVVRDRKKILNRLEYYLNSLYLMPDIE